jgi:serine/threonine protein phosphatase PrpC
LKTESQETACVLDQKDDVATQSKAKKQQEKNDFCYFAIYDGHGNSGKDASLAASDYI